MFVQPTEDQTAFHAIMYAFSRTEGPGYAVALVGAYMFNHIRARSTYGGEPRTDRAYTTVEPFITASDEASPPSQPYVPAS